VDVLRDLAGGDRRSIGKADRIVTLILKTPALFEDVVAGFSHHNPVIRMRCADVAEKVSAAHPEWLQPHKEALLSFASTVQEKEVRWHMAQMFPRLQLSAMERRRAVALLFEYLDDQSRIVKTFSMQALFQMSEGDSKLRARVIPILRDAVRKGSPAARSRAKKLLTTC
jgi:hypothetical protein